MGQYEKALDHHNTDLSMGEEKYVFIGVIMSEIRISQDISSGRLTSSLGKFFYDVDEIKLYNEKIKSKLIFCDVLV